MRPSRLLSATAIAAALTGVSLPAAADQTLFGNKWAEVGSWGDAWGDDPPPPQQPVQTGRPDTKPMAATTAPRLAPVVPVAAPAVPVAADSASPRQDDATMFGGSWPEAGGWDQAWSDGAHPEVPDRARIAPQAPHPQVIRAAADMPPATAPSLTVPVAHDDNPFANVGRPAAQRPAEVGGPAGAGSPEPAKPESQASQPVQLTADQIVHDRDLGIVTAKGRVVIVQGDQTLTADVVSYNLKQDVMTASGNVVMTEASGEVTSADYFELTGDFKNGVAEEIRLIMVDHSRMAAAAATRVGGVRTDFDKAVYTPCEPCREHPERAPLWQAKAERVTHDQAAQEIEYRDAWLEFMGVPVAYTPYLAHPDPTVKRRSGLLPATIGNSSSLGSSLTTPYYWVLTDNEDLTLSPRWLFEHFGQTTTSTQNVAQSALQRVVLAGEHRWTGAYGETKTVASLTADQTTGDLRGHVNAEGRFDISRTWRAGYMVQRQSDETYSQVYSFPLVADRPWLTSRPYLEGFGERDYALAEGFAFQGLTDTDSAGTKIPLVLPHLAYQHLSSPGRWGGLWMVDTDMLAYNRVVGASAERLSSRVGWQLPYTSRSGELYTLTTSFRGEGYHSDISGTSGSSGDGRAIPQASLEYRFPFVGGTKSFQQVITPLGMVAASPNISNNDRIPNEDSVNFELDDTNILRPDPVPGLDRGLGGVRAAYGLRWNGYPYRGGMLELQAAQGWREHLDASLPAGSGFSDHFSDYVGHAAFQPGTANISLFDRIRLAKDDLTVQRQEAGVSLGPKWLSGSTSYVYSEKTSPDAPIQFTRRHSFNSVVSSQMTRYWSVTGGMENNLDNSGAPLSWSGRVVYNDECFAMITNLTHTTVTNGDLLPGTTISFNLVLKTLGQVPVAAF